MDENLNQAGPLLSKEIRQEIDDRIEREPLRMETLEENRTEREVFDPLPEVFDPLPNINYPYPREVNIRPLARGYIVKIGCQELAFVDTEELSSMLKQYLDHPEETEELYRKGELFGKK